MTDAVNFPDPLYVQEETQSLLAKVDNLCSQTALQYDVMCEIRDLLKQLLTFNQQVLVNIQHPLMTYEPPPGSKS